MTIGDALNVRARAPLRLGLAGGGTDLSPYCNEYGGNVLNATIDVPAGSGLGASSALVVALIEAFRYALHLPLGPYDVAKLAFDIERVHLGLAGGRQDQYSAAFGGVNFIEFLPDDRVIVNPLRIRREILNEFEASLVICFTGQSRRSDTIIKEQVAGLKQLDSKTVARMHELKQDAIEMKLALLRGDIRRTAEILGHSWAAKKATAAGVATEAVEKLYDAAMAADAWAGKVSGAGGGGFLMFLTDPENSYRLIRTLNEAGGKASSVKFTFEGAEGWPICP